MSEKKNDNNVAKTPDGNTVEIVEKKGFIATVKDKASAFEAKHPTGVNMVKTGIKVGLGFAGGVLAKCGWDALTGKNASNDPDYIPAGDIETEVVFEEVNDDNN